MSGKIVTHIVLLKLILARQEESMTNMHHSRASEQDQTAVSRITESNKIARDKKSRVALYVCAICL